MSGNFAKLLYMHIMEKLEFLKFGLIHNGFKLRFFSLNSIPSYQFSSVLACVHQHYYWLIIFQNFLHHRTIKINFHERSGHVEP